MIAAAYQITHRRESLRVVAERSAAVSPESWLSLPELEELSQLRDAQRRKAWLAGRFLAKQTILEAITPWPAEANRFIGLLQQGMQQQGMSNSACDICILSRNEKGQGVSPLVFVQGKLQPWTLSISHGSQAVTVALALEPDVRLGVDIADISGLDQSFASLWFTDSERALIATGMDQASPDDTSDGEASRIGAIWAAKEAAYKALNEGESFAPRRFEVASVRAGHWKVTWQVAKQKRECQVKTISDAETVQAIATVGTSSLRIS